MAVAVAVVELVALPSTSLPPPTSSTSTVATFFFVAVRTNRQKKTFSLSLSWTCQECTKILMSKHNYALFEGN